MPPRSPLLDRIEIIPGKRSGKACIVGTRITVYDVLSCLAAGMTAAEVLADYPDLCEDDVQACLVYAATREGILAQTAA